MEPGQFDLMGQLKAACTPDPVGNFSIAELILSALTGALASHYVPNWFNKYILRSPDLSGWWTFVVDTKHSSYNPYIGMKLYYEVMLVTEGHNKFTGRGEKDREKSEVYEGDHIGEDRSHISISCTVNSKILGPNRVYVAISETAKHRESSAQHYLVYHRKPSKMYGTFVSFVAKQEGTVEWYRRSPLTS